MAQERESLLEVFHKGVQEAANELGVTGTGCGTVKSTLEGAVESGILTDEKLPAMTTDDLVPGLEISPFASIVWNSVYAQEDWAGIVQRARTWHDKMEYMMVLEGARRCATLHIYPQNYDETIDRIAQDKLVWLPIQRTKSYSGFSHKHLYTDHLDMNSSVYGVLATNLEDAEEFREASRHSAKKRVDHAAIGELLGFPSCCIEAFNRWWPQFYDPVYQSAQETSEHQTWVGELYNAVQVTPHVATHQMLRYVGFRLTSHFPCSLDCEASVDVGKTWIEVGKKHDPRGLDALLEILRLPGEWSCLNGIAVIETEPFTVTTNSMPTRSKFAVRWNEVRE